MIKDLLYEVECELDCLDGLFNSDNGKFNCKEVFQKLFKFNKRVSTKLGFSCFACFYLEYCCCEL